MRPLMIVGDAFLDVDVEGAARRLCPDAPVPVVDTERTWRRPGGAGLAAMLAARDVSHVVLVTAVGRDDAGRELSTLLGRDVEVISLPLNGETVRKTRFRAHGQSLLRLDAGDGRVAPGPLPHTVVDAVRGASAVLVSDYGRGMSAHPGIRAELGDVADAVPIVWDPHPEGAPPVAGTRLATPNLAEAQRFVTGSGEPGLVAAELREHWDAAAVCVTTGSEGAVLADGTDDTTANANTSPENTRRPDGKTADTAAGSRRIAAAAPPAGRVVDACGAGDRFAAAAAAALAGGASVRRAVADAVDSATRFVSAGGAAGLSVDHEPVSTPATHAPAAVTHSPANDSAVMRDALGGGASAGPVLNEDAFALAEHVRARGGRVVATGGCFDLLHPGHLRLLRQASAFGDALVVCLNSDDSVRRLKGPGRPLLPDGDRAAMLAALSCVDGVVVFDEPNPVRTLERLRPDVWVKGADYAEVELPERTTVQRHGGRVELVPPLAGYSTTRLAAAASRSNGGS